MEQQTKPIPWLMSIRVFERYFVPMPYFCYLTIQVDLVNLLTVADKAKTLYESLGLETGGDELTLGSADRWIWTRPGSRACSSRFNGREEARTGSHKASDIRQGHWSIFYACRVPIKELILNNAMLFSPCYFQCT